MRAVVLTTLLFLVAFSGCLSESTSPVGTDGDRSGSEELGFDADSGPEGDAPEEEPIAHGEPTVVEDEQDAALDQGAWFATRTVDIHNDFGGADRSDVGIDLSRGDVIVRASDDADYHYYIEILGVGGTQQGAETARDSVRWSHEDDLASGVLRLTTIVESDLQTSPSCSQISDLRFCTGAGWTASIVAYLPDAPAHDLEVDTASADVEVRGLQGSRLDVDTSSGDASLVDLRFGQAVRDASSGDTGLADVRFGRYTHTSSSGDLDVAGAVIDVLSTDLSSGDVDMVADVGDFTHESSSGDLEAILDILRTGTFHITTSSGDVEMRVDDGPDHGYDVRADSSSGDVDIDIDDGKADYYEDNRAHVRTDGFGRRDIQTTMSITTSSGDITVES